jgi:RNA polymerase sigma-70 factor, ECF subfamily
LGIGGARSPSAESIFPGPSIPTHMTDTYNERKLVIELQSGNREAFEHLLDLFEGKVYGLVYRMVGSQDAEDVAQEALVQICNSIRNFKGRSSLSTWIYRVASNVCLEYRRKRRPESVPLEDNESYPNEEPMNDPLEVAVRMETKSRVEEAVNHLPDIHREVIVLHELRGLTYDECAEVLGCPVGTVKSRLSNALDKLREMLREYVIESEMAK